MKLDDILQEIGEFGLYQKRIYLSLCLPMINVGAFMVMVIVVLYTPKHRCKIPGVENDTFAAQNDEHRLLIDRFIPYSDATGFAKCHMYSVDDVNICLFKQPVNASVVPCQEWVYDDSVFISTFTEKVNLVCEDALKTSHGQMVFFFGVLVGDNILGLISDTYGRRVALSLAFVTMAAASLATTFSPEFYSFAILQFVVGGAAHGAFVIGTVIALELVGPSYRVWTGVPLHICFTIGLTYISGVAYWLRDWYNISLACAIPAFLCLFHWWLIPESARWLASKNKMVEYETTLRHIAKVNGTRISDDMFAKTPTLLEQTEPDEKKIEGRVWHIFTSRVLFTRTMILCFNWFVVSMTFYGVTLNAGNMAGNFFLNFFLMAVAGFPGYVLAIDLVNRIGRRKSNSLFMCLGGLACLCTIFTVLFGGKELQPLTITLAVIGKMGASAAFCCIYLFTSELMPTVIRNQSMGICSGTARIGAMVSPYIAKSGELIGGKFGQAEPLVIFGALSIAAGLLLLLLPETLCQKLPDTIEEGEQFGKNIHLKNEEEGGEKMELKKMMTE